MKFTQPINETSTETLNEQLAESGEALEQIKANPKQMIRATTGYFFENGSPKLNLILECTVDSAFVANELDIICMNIEQELKKR